MPTGKPTASPTRASDDELKELVGRALTAARKREGSLTSQDVAAIAAELGLAPADVDAARAELTREREEVARRAEHRARWIRRLRRWALLAAGATAAVTVLSVWSASTRLQQLESEARTAEARLEAVLDRQARLAPQVVALAAGDGDSLRAAAAAVEQARSMDDRLEASRAFAAAIARAVAAGAAADAVRDERWRDLGYELTGSENRISVETQRWRQRLEAWRAASGAFSSRAACAVGAARCRP